MEGIGKILIIKTGGTKPAMAARRGDFEDWILAGLGTDVDRTIAVDVYDGGILPSYSDVCGVVITG